MRRNLMIAVLWLACPAAARGDGGTVRLSERQGAYQVTVFTSPTPIRAGMVDISVLVQEAASGDAVEDASVSVRVAPVDRPNDAATEPATAAAATNKLFRSAFFELPRAGRWRATLSIAGPLGPAAASFVFVAAKPPPRWPAIWSWICWPALVIALFGVHQFLVNRKESRAISKPKGHRAKPDVN